MAETSAIEWTDSTINFWWGCSKISIGCDHCYAETWAKRTGHDLWGNDVPRLPIKSVFKTLLKLNQTAEAFRKEHGRRRRVFMQSMSDLFDKEVPGEWFAVAWGAIHSVDDMDVQIVTKRLPMVDKRIEALGNHALAAWPRNAGLIASVVNQEEADRDIPRLIALKVKFGIPWIGLSMEPLLGKVVLRDEWLRDLDWVIAGGESGTGARPMHPDWARSLRDQCAGANVPFHFKQWGEWAPLEAFGGVSDGPITDRKGNVRDWMNRYVICADRGDRLRGHSFTEHATDLVYKVGKKRAGRLLDGVTHDGFPFDCGWRAHQGTRWGRKMWGKEVRAHLAYYGEASGRVSGKPVEWPADIAFPWKGESDAMPQDR